MKKIYFVIILLYSFCFNVTYLKADKYNMDVSELGASFSHVRTKYLFGGTIYPDLDERLYFSKNESEELYNPDVRRREHSIRDLILLAKHEDTALH